MLTVGCRQAGLTADGAELIRAGENTLYRLRAGVVARVSRQGRREAADKEVRVSHWLQQVGVRVVEALPDIDQPVEVDGRAVTFWRELPDHREGDPEHVADALRHLHQLHQPPPELDLPPLDPFVRLEERMTQTTVFDEAERRWLLDHLNHLTQQYELLPLGLPRSAVHGDAWAGNIVTTSRDQSPVLLDLERFAHGPPEWDLASVAVDYLTFETTPPGSWAQFCHRYGHDVTDWSGYQVLRDARELRKVTFAAQMAGHHPRLRQQARHRLACIRGQHGPRPWQWPTMA